MIQISDSINQPATTPITPTAKEPRNSDVVIIRASVRDRTYAMSRDHWRIPFKAIVTFFDI